MNVNSPYGDAVNAAIISAANATPDVEICGIVRIVDGEICFVQMPNKAADPAAHFRLDMPLGAPDDDILAIVHSHPSGPAWPSCDDLRQQQAGAIAWGICLPRHLPDHGLFWFGAGIDYPLDNRPYRHAVTDCYALVRDYYAAHFGITLIDRPREWGWWLGDDNHQNEDFYASQFTAAGFTQIARPVSGSNNTVKKNTLQKGDVALAKIRSGVINHALIWQGDGLLLHHLAGRDGYDAGRLPRCDPAERWARYIVMWARHNAHIGG